MWGETARVQTAADAPPELARQFCKNQPENVKALGIKPGYLLRFDDGLTVKIEPAWLGLGPMMVGGEFPHAEAAARRRAQAWATIITSAELQNHQAWFLERRPFISRIYYAPHFPKGKDRWTPLGDW
jgi:hypothetical protein